MTVPHISMTPADNYSGIEVIGLNEARKRVQDLLTLARERYEDAVRRNYNKDTRAMLVGRVDALQDALEVLR